MKLMTRFEHLNHEDYYLCYEYFEDTKEKMVFIGQYDKDETELVGNLFADHHGRANVWAVYHNESNCTNVQLIFKLDDPEIIMHIVPELL